MNTSICVEQEDVRDLNLILERWICNSECTLGNIHVFTIPAQRIGKHVLTYDDYYNLVNVNKHRLQVYRA
jgi:hypothetical protein